jgi:hypothetical protein
MKLNLDLDAKLPTGALGLAVAPDGSAAYVACADGVLYDVDLDTGESNPFAEKHASFASGCVLLPDGKATMERCSGMTWKPAAA